jgi:hypothetical protein
VHLQLHLQFGQLDYIANLLSQLVIMNHEDVYFQVSELKLRCKVIGCSYFEHIVILKLSFPISELDSRCKDILFSFTWTLSIVLVVEPSRVIF